MKFVKIKNVEKKQYEGKVYDLEVENTNTYNIDKLAVHNSAAGSIIAWFQGITEVDSIKYGLIFERFLNEDRADPPDIDLDFDSDKRYLIEEHLIDKYGEDKVAHIISFGTYGSKGVIRDVGRVLDIDYKLTNKLSGTVQDDEILKEAFQRLISENSNSEITSLLVENNEFTTACERLQGIVRHYSKHAGGTVITPGSLENYIPIMRVKDSIVTGLQEGGDEREMTDMGVLKLDILGLNWCRILRKTIELINKRHGINYWEKVWAIDYNDKKLMSEFAKGNTTDVFQFGSNGMRELIMKTAGTLNDKTMSNEDKVVLIFNDLIAINAGYRPAIIASGNTELFANNKHKDPDEIEYIDDLIRPILSETYGAMLYQEHMLMILNQVAGFTMAEADKSRKVLKLLFKGKKDHTDFEKMLKKFEDGCRKNGVSDGAIQKLLNMLAEMSDYSFNKCLSGDTKIKIANRGPYTQEYITIKDIYNCGAVISAQTKNKLRIYSMFDDKQIRYNVIKEVYESGIKKVYEIETEDGHKIKASLDHKFLTPWGWKRLSDFKQGDKILIDTEKNEYQKIGRKSIAKGIKYGSSMSGFPKGELNPGYIDGKRINWEKVQEELKNIDYCMKCDAKNCRLEDHHIEGDISIAEANVTSNILRLCVSCHKKEHYKRGRTKRSERGRPTIIDIIKSVTYIGEEMTYDIEMEAPHHNFVAQRFITHNSHSCSYAQGAVQGMFFKVYYTIEYITSLLNCTEHGDKKKKGKKEKNPLEEHLKMARRMGYKILPPCINKSTGEFIIEDNDIRSPISLIKNVGDNVGFEIAKYQPFKDLNDFFNKEIDWRIVNKRAIERLIQMGAFDCLFDNRKLLFDAFQKWNEELNRKGRITLVINKYFYDDDDSYQDYTELEKLNFELEMIGFYFSLHPLERFYNLIDENEFVLPSKIKKRDNKIIIAGYLNNIKVHTTKYEEKMAFLDIIDTYDGSVSVTVWPEQYNKYKKVLKDGTCIAVKVKRNKSNEKYADSFLVRDSDEGKSLIISLDKLAKEE